MKISYKWLKEYIHTGLSPEEIAEILTDTGLEVEGIEEVETIKGGLKGVVIGEVVTCEPHPNADRLKKTTVDIGEEEPLRIVCGAPNVTAGQKVAVATVGTLIYTDEGHFKIKKSKIRGEVSEGMICAEDELNLGQSHEGIMVLEESAKTGMPAADYFGVESDYVLEIGLTPNRADAMSHYGVARDLRAALLRRGYENVELNLPSIVPFSVYSKDLMIDIKVEDPVACPRYMGVSLKGVKVGASPGWLQNRLRAIGVGPVNNVVDITNYVLHETGHPLHAFDADKIKGNRVIVKSLPSGTKFTTLDEKERELSDEDLMIYNEQEGMCIAGVFGGLESGVSKETTNVFIESAYFNPVVIRKTAKRHGLNTDASFRYERGVDPDMTEYALKRAAILIRDIAGGHVSMDIRDVNSGQVRGFEVELNLERMARLLGKEIEINMVRSILRSLDIKIKAENGRDLVLSVPPYRVDVRREADVIEEILRIYGFNAIDFNDKMHISIAPSDPKGEGRYRERISSFLSSRGFAEIMNNSLTKGHYFQGYGFDPERSVNILNPLSKDLDTMRQSLLFGGLEVVAYNNNRQRPNLRLYEFGQVYRKENDGYTENKNLGMWLSGKEKPENWKNSDEAGDFFTLKAEVSSILSSLGFDEPEERETEHEIYQYGLELLLHNQPIAHLGKLNTRLCRENDIRQEVYYAEVNWDYLVKKAGKNSIRFSEVPKYPEVRRDLALLLDKNIPYKDLRSAAQKAGKKLLRRVNLFDVYEGKNLPEGKKSYALSFILRDDAKTLNDRQVDEVMSDILEKFKKEFSAELR